MDHWKTGKIPKNTKKLKGTRKPGRNKYKSHVKALDQTRAQGVRNGFHYVHPLIRRRYVSLPRDG